MTTKHGLRHSWLLQRGGAKKRGIGFHLSYEDWLAIWTESGHLHERGRGRGKYHMCRYGDVGAYEIGNVYIALHEINCIRLTDRTKSPETLAKLSASLKGRKCTWGDKISAANKGNPKLRAIWLGKHLSEEHKRSISETKRRARDPQS